MSNLKENVSHLFKRLINFCTVLKLRQNAFAVQVCTSTLQGSGNDKTLGAVLGPEDATAVGLAEAPLLDDGQDDGRLFVVEPDKIVMNFSEEVL